VGAAYATAFWIPAAAAAIYLYLLFKQGDLSAKEAMVFVAWLIVSAGLQVFAPSILVWCVGLVSQAVLAVLLAVKWDMAT
jgi:hypothetical protein